MTEKFEFNVDTVDRMSYMTGYDVLAFMELYQMFVDNNQPLILEYFTRVDTEPDVNSFIFLEKLLSEYIKLNNLLKNRRDRLNRFDDWNLLSFLDEIWIRLDTIDNTSKWVRSSKTKNSWRNNAIQTDHILAQGETLEQISANLTGVGNSQNDWIKLSLQNSLLENDYDVEGGNKLQITKGQLSSPNFSLQSVVDNLINENMYGIDIQQKLTFEGNDLKVCSHVETVKQSVNIYALLSKGDIPEFPTFGRDRNLNAGGSLGVYSYSALVRQLTEVFNSDDSLRNFQVTEISYDNGDLRVEYEVDTFYHLIVRNSALISNQ